MDQEKTANSRRKIQRAINLKKEVNLTGKEEDGH